MRQEFSQKWTKTNSQKSHLKSVEPKAPDCFMVDFKLINQKRKKTNEKLKSERNDNQSIDIVELITCEQ